MSAERLERLAEDYPRSEPRLFFELARERAVLGELSILGLAALAVDLTLDDILNLGPKSVDSSMGADAIDGTSIDSDLSASASEHNPLIMEAFSRANGDMDPSALADMTSEQLEGVLGNTKGHYFEVLVVDRLNNGEAVGEIKLQEGQTAELAESPNQPAWDVRIVNEDGTVDDLLQLKATEDIGRVAEALKENPDIRVATPSEIDSSAENILSTDISNTALEHDVAAQLGEYTQDTSSSGANAGDVATGSDASAAGGGDAGGAGGDAGAAGGGDAGGASGDAGAAGGGDAGGAGGDAGAAGGGDAGGASGDAGAAGGGDAGGAGGDAGAAGGGDAGGAGGDAGAAGGGVSVASGVGGDSGSHLSETSASAALDAFAEVAFDAIPVVSGVFVVAMEGRKVLMGTAHLEEALERGSKRLGTAAVFTTAGALMTAAGAPAAAIVPPLLAARILAGRIGNRSTMGDIARENANSLIALTPQPVLERL